MEKRERLGGRGIAEPPDERNGRGKRRDVLRIELFELRQQPFAFGGAKLTLECFVEGRGKRHVGGLLPDVVGRSRP